MQQRSKRSLVTPLREVSGEVWGAVQVLVESEVLGRESRDCFIKKSGAKGEEKEWRVVER